MLLKRLRDPHRIEIHLGFFCGARARAPTIAAARQVVFSHVVSPCLIGFGDLCPTHAVIPRAGTQLYDARLTSVFIRLHHTATTQRVRTALHNAVELGDQITALG